MEKDNRILLVDRDTDFINELTNYLLAAGYKNIESIDNCASALTKLKLNHFDIVIMDIFAPDMKGLEYVRKIRKLKPEIKTFLMIKPEHKEIINKELLREAKLKCVLKPFIKQNLLNSIKEL